MKKNIILFDQNKDLLDQENKVISVDGVNGPEPTDMAIGQVLTGNFLNAFRANVAKYIVVITDVLPSGDDDAFDPLFT